MKRQENRYDAIVVGSGMSGGWAAKELCEKGLKTLVLERGRDVPHPGGYTTTNLDPWDHEHRGAHTSKDKEESPIQSKCYAYTEATKHFFVNDKEHPYKTSEEQPFHWIRGYHVGGRSLMWHRQCYRFSDLDFGANLKDGHGTDWPIRYADMEKWYGYVENFVGISGSPEGLAHLPDSNYIPPMEMNCVEKHMRKRIKETWEDRTMIIGRTAHLTEGKPGRGPCQYRDNCHAGCPFGGYFSANSATLPAAARTGNMTLRPWSIAHSVMFDEQTGKATGVRIVDAESLDVIEYYADVVFICASTIGSTSLLLNSKSNRFPNGMGGNNDALGNYLGDHIFQAGAIGYFDGWKDEMYQGHRPNGIYVPRFRNVNEDHPDFLRGYGMQGSATREGWKRGNDMKGFGADFKEEITNPGPWRVRLNGFGEMLPNKNNRIELLDETDKWGLPLVNIECNYRENEETMRQDMMKTAAELLEASGATDVEMFMDPPQPGFCIHEMGTARMGKDPKTSVLNKNNQIWDVPNVFVTDGASMTSTACQNPSLTYMALTARAVDFAVSEMKKGNL